MELLVAPKRASTLAVAAAVLLVAAAVLLAYRWYCSPSGRSCMKALASALSGPAAPMPPPVKEGAPPQQQPSQQPVAVAPQEDADTCVRPPASAAEEADPSFTTWAKLADDEPRAAPTQGFGFP